MEFTCIASIAMTFGIAGIANEFAPWFFGNKFLGVVPVLKSISPTVIFVSCANVIRTQYLIPLGKDRIFVISVWLGAISNLVINNLLIPKYGALGAVIGTDIAEFVVMFYQIWKTRRELPILNYIRNSIGYFFIGILMYYVVRFMSRFGSGEIDTLCLEILSGGIVYIFFAGCLYMRTHQLKLSDLKK